jgi:glucose-1-phosphate thymidylyltransferase
VGGRPMLQYVVERMHAVPQTQVRVVTRSDKHDVAQCARRLGADVILGCPSTPAASIILGVRGCSPDDVVLLGYPDTIWQPADGFTRLVDRFEDADAVLGLFTSAALSRSDVVSIHTDGRVARVDVKPSRPRSDLIWGCAAARAVVLEGLAAYEEPGLLFDDLARGGRVRGVVLSDDYIDVGTPDALAAARNRYGA